MSESRITGQPHKAVRSMMKTLAVPSAVNSVTITACIYIGAAAEVVRG